MKVQTLCVVGGTGFVGGHLVTHLANGRRRLKVLTRHRERHKALAVLPEVDVIEADIREQTALESHFSGCDAVINLVGILNGNEAEFRALHAELPRRVVVACRQVGVPRLLHMSALNADSNGPSIYLRTKGQGEQAVLQVEGIQTTRFCPSIIFGPDDSFFNRFATLLKLGPVLPLACPNARFAPVYVGDVVRAFEVALEDEATYGKRYELCGPRIYTLKELVEYTAQLIGCKRLIIGLPDSLARLQGHIFEHLPGQLFTMDNYHSLQVDSVCRSDGLGALGITPHTVETIMHRHFQHQDARAYRYSAMRNLARRD
jgi:uncharacterized protein YbjT (DUF2867 family)